MSWEESDIFIANDAYTANIRQKSLNLSTFLKNKIVNSFFNLFLIFFLNLQIWNKEFWVP